jgi:4-amino-4-deoxy-L-arabinose transferase-like glycosyltransferase
MFKNIIFRDRRQNILVILFLVYVIVFASATVGGDGFAYYTHLKSMALDMDLDYSNNVFIHEGQPQGVAKADKGFLIEGLNSSQRYLIGTGPGTALFTLPFYSASLPLTGVVHYRDDAYLRLQGDVFIHSFFFLVGILFYSLITLVLMYKLALKLTSKRIAFALGLIMLFASPWGFYSISVIWPSHAITVFLLTLSFFVWFENRNKNLWQYDVLLGVLLGGILFTRYVEGFVFVPFFIWYIFKRRKRVFHFFAPWLVIVLLLLSYWNYQFGTINYLEKGSSDAGLDFDIFRLSAFFSLLFNLKTGFFIFHPIFILSLYGFYLYWQRDKELGLMLSALFVFLVLSYVLPYNLKGMEWTAMYFGVRYLTILSPVMVIGLIPVIEKFRANKKALVIMGILLLFSFTIMMQTHLGACLPDEQRSDFYILQHMAYTFGGGFGFDDIINGLKYANNVPVVVALMLFIFFIYLVYRGFHEH